MSARYRKWTTALIVLALSLVLCNGLAQAQQQQSPEASLIPMNEKERAWLDAHRDLRLGVWLSAPPIMFRGDDGSLQGIVPAYIDILTQKLGLNPRRIRASGFNAAWELAKAGEVDMMPAITGTPERASDMLISKPYFHMPIVLVTRADFPFITGLDDFTGRIVAVNTGHVSHIHMVKDHPDIIPMPVESPKLGLDAVAKGQADAFMGTEASVAYLSRMHGITNIRIAAITEYSYRVSIGIRKDWPILLTLVDRALASIPDKEKKDIHDYWTVLHDSQWVERPHVWQIAGGILAGAFCLMGIILFWNRRLAAEVKKLKQAETHYRKKHGVAQRVIESADVIIVGLDYAGQVQLLNRAGETLTGYSREELIGRNWFDVVVPKDQYPFVWDEFTRLLNEGGRASSDTFENPILTKTGETRNILWRNSVTGDHKDGLAAISFGTDITNRLQAEEELRLTQFAMDNAAVGIFRVKQSGRIVYINRSAAKMLGYTRSELKRKTIPEIAPDLTAQTWSAFWHRLKYNQMLTFELSIRDKSGKAFPAELTVYYLLFKGTELAIGFFSDISERKRVEKLRQDVERMVQHDLRSPTLAVQTLFKMFDRADNLTTNQHELLNSVKNASLRMLHIIDMSRTLYKMEAGTYTPITKPVDLLHLVNHVAEELRPLMHIKRISLIVNLEGKPVSKDNVFMVESDEIPCYALLSNLLKNAIEASPTGESVTLDFNASNNNTIKVHNQGVIPEKIRKTFFDKYVTFGKEQGTGLGTYTSHLIATSLGGQIVFTTSEEDGTTITVILPCPKRE
ncbi:MAG: PAS domain S-box protein [Pseudodesulfovibrio sp.]|nr:PAS domain S-box protein [Pseudodesulfovibrio sp.]